MRLYNALLEVCLSVCILAGTPAAGLTMELALAVAPDEVQAENRYEDLEARVKAMPPSVLRSRCTVLLNELRGWIWTIRGLNEHERSPREEFQLAFLLSLVRGTLRGVEQSLGYRPPPTWDDKN
jgi:hypothetical protein